MILLADSTLSIWGSLASIFGLALLPFLSPRFRLWLRVYRAKIEVSNMFDGFLDPENKWAGLRFKIPLKCDKAWLQCCDGKYRLALEPSPERITDQVHWDLKVTQKQWAHPGDRQHISMLVSNIFSPWGRLVVVPLGGKPQHLLLREKFDELNRFPLTYHHKFLKLMGELLKYPPTPLPR